MSEQKHFKIVIEKEIMEGMKEHEMDALKMSLNSFIDAGFIELDEQNELYIDRKFLVQLSRGSQQIEKSRDKYGVDEEGFVVFQFENIG